VLGQALLRLTGYRRPMKDAPSIAADLSTPERLLFCLASRTEWKRAGVTQSTVTTMIVRGLIQRDPLARLSLTKQGWETLDTLLLQPLETSGQ
jgi:hypothetical protein